MCIYIYKVGYGAAPNSSATCSVGGYMHIHVYTHTGSHTTPSPAPLFVCQTPYSIGSGNLV